jgi:CRISPR-associated protein Csa3
VHNIAILAFFCNINKMKTYISPIGFDTSHIFSLLIRFGVESHDKVILIRPKKDDERSIRAIEELTELVRKIANDITVVVHMVNHLDYTDALYQCINIIDQTSKEGGLNNKIFVNLSGGPREILIALNTASLALSEKIHLVTSFSDVERMLKVISLPHIMNTPEQKEFGILTDIKKNGPTSFAEIASRLQISESTISRQCSKLSGLQWIDIETRGKNKYATITPSGEIMIFRYNKII